MEAPEPDYAITSNFEIKVERPKGWKDYSAYNFEAPKADPDSQFFANINITQANLPLGLSYDAHVKAEYAVYKAELDGFDLVHHRKGQVHKSAAVELLFDWMMEGHAMRQRVVFLKSGMRKLLTFSAVAAKADYDAQAAFFNAVLASLKT